jgi:hypothetical protein
LDVDAESGDECVCFAQMDFAGFEFLVKADAVGAVVVALLGDEFECDR